MAFSITASIGPSVFRNQQSRSRGRSDSQKSLYTRMYFIATQWRRSYWAPRTQDHLHLECSYTHRVLTLLAHSIFCQHFHISRRQDIPEYKRGQCWKTTENLLKIWMPRALKPMRFHWHFNETLCSQRRTISPWNSYSKLATTIEKTNFITTLLEMTMLLREREIGHLSVCVCMYVCTHTHIHTE